MARAGRLPGERWQQRFEVADVAPHDVKVLRDLEPCLDAGRVDSIMLTDGEMKVLSQQEVISLILPYGSGGMSGDVVQMAHRTGMIAVIYRASEV
jgi:hypothetical protein